MATTTTVLDLKGSQQTQNTITVFKNHEKKWLKITPTLQKTSYKAGDLVRFAFKGQGGDYINFNGSSLWVHMKASVDASLVPAGLLGLISRFQFRSGVFDFEDIHHYDRYMTSMAYGNVKKNTQILDIKWKTSAPDTLSDNFQWLRVPLITCLDAGGYIPVYNLAEELEMRLTLNDPYKFIRKAEEDGANITYEIDDLYFMVDGITATSGGTLNETPFKFHSHTCLGFQDQMATTKFYIKFHMMLTDRGVY